MDAAPTLGDSGGGVEIWTLTMLTKQWEYEESVAYWYKGQCLNAKEEQDVIK